MEQKYLLGFIVSTILLILGLSLIIASGIKPEGPIEFKPINLFGELKPVDLIVKNKPINLPNIINFEIINLQKKIC